MLKPQLFPHFLICLPKTLPEMLLVKYTVKNYFAYKEESGIAQND